jgi:hypothetical protein
MPFNGSGTFVRLNNWSNDAANNLPISATKFDTEDNDFASGLSACLTRDGQGGPSSALTWGQPLTLNGATGTSPLTVGCTGGMNNPSLQAKVIDSTGVTLNLTTAQSLALAIQGTNALSIASNGNVSIAQALGVTGNQTVGGTLGVTGNQTVGGTLGVTGNSTLTGTLAVNGAGTGLTVANNATISGALTVSTGGSSIKGGLTIATPASGTALTVNGVASSFAAGFVGPNSTGVSFGAFVQAGTNSSDKSFQVANASAGSTYFLVRGDGLTQAMDDGGTLQAVGWRGTPMNTQSGTSYTLALSDRGKAVYFNGGSAATCTVPANVLSAGDVVTVIANVTGGLTIAQGASLSLFWANGTSPSASNRTLSTLGIATIEFLSDTSAIITGSGLS